MKKIPFLIVILTLFSSWYGAAQFTTYSYSEDFEAEASSRIANNGADGTWALGTSSHSLLRVQDLAVFNNAPQQSQGGADSGASTPASSHMNTSSLRIIRTQIENVAAIDSNATSNFDLSIQDVPITIFSTDFKYEIGPDATDPLFISATPQNYTLSEVNIAWYKDGVLIPGETGLTLPISKGGFYEIVVTFIDTNISANAVGVNVVQLRDFNIPQGISPNGDGKNDTFDLSDFDVQRIEIFNRLGTRVYSKDNYTNEWFGQSDNGDELPVGTYFYTMIYQGGEKTKSSWVYLNK